ncbi:MAG: CaiB/BaiF CoA-transferase family protein [Burkholderiaceae bacterium]
MAGDLEGIRVLDFSQVLAGPFAGQQLAWRGAQVIKVEPVEGGDQMRNRMLPSPLAAVDMASSFLTLNSGKRSLALDLKSADGLAVAHDLIRSADVLLHNFRAGVVDRLGLDYDAVRRVNPAVIWCSISGFGQQGPRNKDAAFDGAIQAASGMMANNGHPETGPTRTGYFPVDMMTGMTAAFAIAGALVRRARTGEGQALDVAMFDAAISLQASAFAQYQVDGNEGGLTGNSSATRHPSADSFPTAEGSILMSATGDGHVRSICEEFGILEVLQDPRFCTLALRQQHRAEFRQVLLGVFATDTAQRIAERLSARGVPISRVNTVAEASADPQLAHRRILVPIGAPPAVGKPVTVMGTAFRGSADDEAPVRLPPALGEHSREVLAELGYDAARIGALIDSGVVRQYAAR